jgi:hypothetical protein
MKTQKQVRAAFWQTFPEFAHLYRSKKRQNQYPADVRCTFVEWLENLRRNGWINEQQANKYTL